MSESWSWIDGVGAIVIAGLAVRGFLRGLWSQLLRLLALAAALAVTRALAPRVSPAVHEWFADTTARTVNGWVTVALFLLLALAAAVFVRSSAKAAADEEIAFSSRGLGAFLGAISGVLLFTAALLCICQIGAPAWTERVIGRSHSRRLISGVERTFPAVLDVHAADAVHAFDRR